MRKHIMHLTIAVMSVSIFIVNLSSSSADGSSFKDININYWGYKSIQWAVDAKIINGYPDGTFMPNQDVDQAEFIAMLIRAYQPSDFTPSTDSTKWSMPYLNYWTKLGWHLIIPSQATNNILLSRGQVAQYLINATGKNYTIDDSIQSLLDTGISAGKSEKSVDGFKKDDLVTRAEAVTFIERLKQFNATLQQNVLVPSIDYENTKYNFTLKLPKNWEGKYDVDDVTVALAGNNINFINKASKYGVLFTISVWSKEYWSANKKDITGNIPISMIGQIGNYVYLFHTPTDVQYDPSNEADYESMFKDIKTIKATFEIKILS